MANQAKRREVVIQDNVIGVLQGENFTPESNFMIKEILQYVKLTTESGFITVIKTSLSNYVR